MKDSAGTKSLDHRDTGAALHPEIQRLINQARLGSTDRIMRLPAVKQKVGYAASSIWKMIKEGTFPPPISIGGRSVGWRENELQAWIELRTYMTRTRIRVDVAAFIDELTTVSRTAS